MHETADPLLVEILRTLLTHAVDEFFFLKKDEQYANGNVTNVSRRCPSLDPDTMLEIQTMLLSKSKLKTTLVEDPGKTARVRTT